MFLQARAPPRCQNGRVPRQARRRFHLRADGPGYQRGGLQNTEYHTGRTPSPAGQDTVPKRARSMQYRGSGIPSLGQARRFPQQYIRFRRIRPRTPQSARRPARRRMAQAPPADTPAQSMRARRTRIGAAFPARRARPQPRPPPARRAQGAPPYAPRMRARRSHRLAKGPYRSARPRHAGCPPAQTSKDSIPRP